MPAARRSRRVAATRATHTVHGETLTQRLFLLRFLHREFGFRSDVAETNDLRGDDATRVLFSALKDTEEGYSTDGFSFVASALIGRANKTIAVDDIKRYDANVRSHLYRINQRRSQPVTFRYFQTLALLYTERVLDRLDKGPRQFCKELNDFVNATKSAASRDFPRFTPASLRKLAFMMATGSGKTLLFHINYLQFLHYNRREPIANVLLITPGPDLSTQHLRELQASGLPCRIFDAGRPRDLTDTPNTIEIIAISRFVPEKKDKGSRVEPSSFSGRNLIFVDEGHRSKSEEGVQRQIRESLAGDDGFVFEYSATFQQAFAGDDDDQRARRDEYGAAICFDYSYKWFLHDGYGKDFTVLNSSGVEAEAGTWSMLAGLFVFAAQSHAFRSNVEALRDYNIASPLGLMVGREIAGSTQDDLVTRADVLSALRFFHRFLRNESGWSVRSLDQLLGKGTPIDAQGHGLTLDEARKYWALAEMASGSDLFEWICVNVLHSPGGGGLVVHRIKGNENEIALRGSEDQNQMPFGLVYIGKAPDLTKAIAPESGIEQSDDHLADAWFPRIDDPGSPVNFLLGAKKFIEGWSSWRVSALGLINIGKSEGSEIIQLFGRGVRLLGLYRSLKRSKYIPGQPPEALQVTLPLLERLFVFAIDSRYMLKFRETIDREGVDGGGFLDFELELWRTIDHPNPPILHLPNWPAEDRFKRERAVRLDASHLGSVPSRRTITVRREARFDRLQSDDAPTARTSSTTAKPLAECSWFRFVDQDKLYIRLCRHAEEQEYDNIGFSGADVRSLLAAQAGELLIQADAQFHTADSWTARRRWEDAAFDLLKGAMDRIYRRAQQTWETQNMSLPAIQEDHPNWKFSYKVRVPQKLAANAPQFVRDLQALIEQCPKQSWTGQEPVIAVAHFGEHLYQPLVLDAENPANAATPNSLDKQELKITPPPLTASEQEFVKMLRDYWSANAASVHASESIYLLRNLSRGKGIGFFESEGFYPDFILWHRNANGRQRLIFIEPHGMRQEDAPDLSRKVHLAMELRNHLADVLMAPGCPIADVTAYIVSATPFPELSRKHGAGWTIERYAEHHILFPASMRASPKLGGLL